MPTYANSRFRRANPWLLIVMLACCCAPLWAGDVGVSTRLKVSDLQAINGDVISYAVSPDGARIVYAADAEIDAADGLFSVPAGGGTVVTLIEGQNGIDIGRAVQISPDGTHAVLLGRISSERDELYAVPVLGGAVVRLSDDLQGNGRVLDFALAGARAIYRAPQDSVGVDELYSVPITGGTPVKLSGALVSGDVRSDYVISPDGTRVIYRAAQETPNVDELYSAPVDGSAAAVKLNGILASSDITQNYVVSADSTRVVYRAAQDTSGVFELYAAPIDGSSPAIKISGDLVDGGDVVLRYFIDPSASRVVYQADQDTNGVNDLYSVPLTGGAVTKLTDGYVAGGGLSTPGWTVSAQRVAFVADRDTDDVFELFTVPIDGGAVVKISGPMVDQGDVDTGEAPRFTGDGARVVYVADQIEDGRNELFSSPAAGGASVKLSGTLAAPSALEAFGTFGPSSVWYLASQDVIDDDDLYRVPADGSVPAAKVNGALAPGGEVRDAPLVSATQLFYLADQDTVGVVELFAAAQSGGAPAKRNDPIVARGGQIRDVFPAPDGQRVVYRGQVENESRNELFAADLTTGQIVPLALALADGDVEDAQFSADGTRMVYRAPQTTRDIDELYAVPIAGGDATQLNPALAPDGTVRTLVASSSTDRVVYVAAQDATGVDELYSVATTGGPVVKLNDPLPNGGRDRIELIDARRVLGRDVHHAVGRGTGDQRADRAVRR
ncbi:MAG: hypothetical protein AAF772_18485, partial [Acidobacteriota bacterium]